MIGLRFRSPVVPLGAFTLATGDVEFRAGRITVLVGPNGGGKTTALRAAAGLVAPASGHVERNGADVCRMTPAARARHIALVVQRPEVGAPFRVRDVASFGRVTMQPDPDRVNQALERVGLVALADCPYHALSGGQQQRVALARALAQHSAGGVLLLDEALSSVDPPETASLVQVIRAESSAGATVLAATHDLALASALADDVWCLRGGRTVAFGPSAELLRADRVTALLGVAAVEARGSSGPIAVADYRAILPGTPR